MRCWAFTSWLLKSYEDYQMCLVIICCASLQHGNLSTHIHRWNAITYFSVPRTRGWGHMLKYHYTGFWHNMYYLSLQVNQYNFVMEAYQWRSSFHAWTCFCFGDFTFNTRLPALFQLVSKGIEGREVCRRGQKKESPQAAYCIIHSIIQLCITQRLSKSLGKYTSSTPYC